MKSYNSKELAYLNKEQEYKDLTIKEMVNDLKSSKVITKKDLKFFSDLEKFKDFF